MSGDSPGWALARLSQTTTTPETSDNCPGPHTCLGAGVDVYIIDSGINTNTHAFGYRVKQLANHFGKKSIKDAQDHGTKVASLIGSFQYGIAKKAKLWACKVDPGKPQSIVKAIEDVIANNKDNRSLAGYKGAHVNEDIEEALRAAEKALISIVLSAGNDGLDLTKTGILRDVEDYAEHAIIVGAVDRHNTRAQYAIGGTNHGSRITIYAPGKDLTGFDKSGNTVTNLEGASFACAYVTGIIAIYYGEEGVDMEPELAKRTLLYNAERGVLRGLTEGDSGLLANDGYLKAKEEARRLGRGAVHHRPYLVPPPPP